MRILQILTLATAVCLGASGFSASAYDTNTSVTLSTTPPQGVIDMEYNSGGISAFQLNASETMRINRNAEGFISLKRDGILLAQIPAQNVIQFHMFMGYTKYTDTGTCQITFFEDETTSPAKLPGNYTVTIPQGFFFFGKDADSYTINKAKEFSWSIKANTEGIDERLGGAISPLEGSTLSSIQRFTIIYPEGTEISCTNEGKKMSTTDENGDNVSYMSYPIQLEPIGADITQFVGLKAKVEDNRLVLSLDEPITKAGTYMLTFAKGAISYTIDGNKMSNTEAFLSYKVEDNSFHPQITPVEGSYAYFPDIETGNDMLPHAIFKITLPQPDNGGEYSYQRGAPYFVPCNADGTFSKSDPDRIRLYGADPVITTDDQGNKQYEFYIYDGDNYGGDFCPAAGDYALVLADDYFYLSGMDGGIMPQAVYYYTCTGLNNIKYTIEPAPEEQINSIKSVKITFPEAESIEVGEMIYATLSNDYASYQLLPRVDGNTVEFVFIDGTKYDASEGTAEFTASGNFEFDANGTWTFMSPKRGFFLKMNDGKTITPVIAQTYRIFRVNRDFKFAVSPAQGVINYDINPNGISAFDITNVLSINRQAKGYIELVRDGEVISQIPAQNFTQLSTYSGYDKYVDPGQVNVTFFKEYGGPGSLPGNYVVRVPEAFFITPDGYYTPSATFAWQVTSADSRNGFVASPADRSQLQELSQVSITFPKASKVVYNPDPIVQEESYYDDDENLQTREVLVYPIDIVNLNALDAELPGFKVEVSGNAATITFDSPINNPVGTYVLTVRNFAFTVDDQAMAGDGSVVYYIAGSGRADEFDFPITPAEGTVASFEPFETGDPYLGEALFEVEIPEGTTVTIERPWLLPVDATGNYKVKDPNGVILAIRKAANANKAYIYNANGGGVQVTPGEWVLYIPEKAFYNANFTSSRYSPALVYTYNVSASESTEYEITPANNAEVRSLRTVTVQFPDADLINLTANGGDHPSCYATLSNGIATYILSAEVANANTVEFTMMFNSELDELGDWTFLGPKSGMTVDGNFKVIYATFHITEGEIKELAKPAIDPAEGKVAEFTKFTITEASGAPILSIGNEVATLYKLNDDKSPGAALAMFLPRATVNGSVIELLNVNGATEVLTPETGYYMLVTPEYMFTTADGKAVPYEFNYTVGDPTGAVEDLAIDADHVTVYTTTGICLMRNADRDELKSLPRGIYLVNGRKQVIK